VQALGYRAALRVHDREIDPEEAALAIALETRQFARRQRTWYRKFDDITWLPAEEPDDVTGTTDEVTPETSEPQPAKVAAAMRALDLAEDPSDQAGVSGPDQAGVSGPARP
jgi:hypothetical protein